MATPIRASGGGLTLSGFNELAREFDRVGKTKAKKVMRKATREAAKIILSQVQAFVPDTADSTGELSERWDQVKVRAVRRSRVRVGVTFFTDTNWTDRSGNDAWYGGLVELGTKKQKPQAYIRIAFDVSKARADRKIVEIARRELFPARPSTR